MRIVLKLSYRGDHYFGWQIQPYQSSIQQLIQDKIKVLTGVDILLTGCGRTDTGVHARNYFAHFDIPDELCSRLQVKSLNALLPDDIAIQNVYRAPDDFHARFDAISRTYIYRLQLVKDPLKRPECFFFKESSQLDFQKLQEAAQLILNLTEFDSFAKTGSNLEKFNCSIMDSFWLNPKPHYFEYHISANRFVRGMVRLIVGMSVNLALGRIAKEEIESDLMLKRKIVKSYSIAAKGLCLEYIEYPSEKLNQLVDLDFRI